MKIDRVILANSIHTLKEENDHKAIALSGDKIVALGSKEEATNWVAQGAVVDSFQNDCVVPGLIDAHTHPIFGLQMVRGARLTHAKDLQDATDMLLAYAGTLNADEWVFAWGLEQTLFGDKDPSANFLDKALPNRNVFVLLYDGHAAVVSSTALKTVGITAGEKLPDGSEICADNNGRPTGFVRELGAMAKVREHMPALSLEEKVAGVKELLNGMAASGLTAIEILDTEDPDTVAIFEKLELEGDLPLKVRIRPWFLALHKDEVLDEIISMQGIKGRRFEVNGAKLMIDGTIENGIAWLYQPDTQGEGTKSLWLNPKDYKKDQKLL